MIREYSAQDADAMIRVWRAASALAHPFLSEAFLTSEEHNMRHVYPEHAAIEVVTDKGQVVGFIAMLGNEIGGLFLDPACHGQGLGRAMVDRAVAQHGPLAVEVFEANTIGRRFYDRYGFAPHSQNIHAATGQPILRLEMPQIPA